MERHLGLAGARRFLIASQATTRHRIASVVLSEPPRETTIGGISLHPHQLSAVLRLESAIKEFNGALLCDEVGLGKTYVALAIARNYREPLIVTPASLSPMWNSALAATRISARLITMESLSRAERPRTRDAAFASLPADFVIVDEAHHVRNEKTNRYFALQLLVRGAKVLLLSATPIHNRRKDLVALLSLFIGSRAGIMTASELSLCIVRREHQHVSLTAALPEVLPTVHHELPDDPPLVDQLTRLPAPIPLRDGGLAGALIGRGLAHQWASSQAALREAVKRRIARSAALCASLEVGTYPTARDLETWIYGEGALQLGFAELLSMPGMGDHEELLAAMRAHLRALEALLRGLPAVGTIDVERAHIVASLRANPGTPKIVAFAQYADTVSMLFRQLAPRGRIAMLTSHGARVAGGPLARLDAIRRFAPLASHATPPGSAEAIDLLLTTDLLSEGVNLQDANVVIHLDVPWTAARMEQRVGRIARLGSPHTHVHVHAIRPPASARRFLESEAIVDRKWRTARSAVGASIRGPVVTGDRGGPPTEPQSESTPAQTERLRATLEAWARSIPNLARQTLSTMPGREGALAGGDRDGTAVGGDRDGVAVGEANEPDACLVSTVAAQISGFIAAVSLNRRRQLVVAVDAEIRSDLASQIQACEMAGHRELPTNPADVDHALDMIRDWFARQSAAAAAGVGYSSALRRRALINRIDDLIAGAPPHLRATRSSIAARARMMATTPQCAAIEAEFDRLLRSDLRDDEWLAAMASAGAINPQRSSTLRAAQDGGLVAHALLLLHRA